MKAFIESLKNRREILKRCIEQAEKDAKIDVQGRLEISDKGEKCDYYHILQPGSKHGRYISKQQMSTVKDLAQRDYSNRTLTKMKQELSALERYLRLLEKGTPEDVYSRMCTARQKLIKPLLVSDEILEQWWAQEPFVQSTHMPGNKIYPTKKGDMVRSKSEVFFADTFLDMGLSYRYEQVLDLHGVSMVPDFSLWDRKRRREVYHEHFGLMDDPDYRQKALRKIDVYRRNGIYVGKNLITTFEGNGSTLNMREMKAMFAELFL